MKNEVIIGHVIYLSSDDAKICINLQQASGEIIGLALAGSSTQWPLKKILPYVQKGNSVKLICKQGQVKKILLVADAVEIDLDENPNLGITFRESVFMNFSGALEQEVVNGESLFIRLKNYENRQFLLSSLRQKTKVLVRFLESCQKGDVLKIFQNSEGNVQHIVNQTKGIEVGF